MKVFTLAFLTLALSLSTVMAGESIRCKNSDDEVIINKDTITYISSSTKYVDVAFRKSGVESDGTYVIETVKGRAQGLESDASFVVLSTSKNQKVTSVQVLKTNSGFGNSYVSLECSGSEVIQKKTK